MEKGFSDFIFIHCVTEKSQFVKSVYCWFGKEKRVIFNQFYFEIFRNICQGSEDSFPLLCFRSFKTEMNYQREPDNSFGCQVGTAWVMFICLAFTQLLLVPWWDKHSVCSSKIEKTFKHFWSQGNYLIISKHY